MFEDNSDKNPSLFSKNTDDNGVIVTLKNFSTSVPTSTINPVLIGNIQGYPLNLSIASYPVGTGDSFVRVISYTFYGKA